MPIATNSVLGLLPARRQFSIIGRHINSVITMPML